jgi:hypothetical protein
MSGRLNVDLNWQLVLIVLGLSELPSRPAGRPYGLVSSGSLERLRQFAYQVLGILDAD